MGPPGPAITLLLFQHDERRVRQLLCEVIGAADTRDAGADDENVEMLDLPCGGNRAGGRGYVHDFCSSNWLTVVEIFVAVNPCVHKTMTTLISQSRTPLPRG